MRWATGALLAVLAVMGAAAPVSASPPVFYNCPASVLIGPVVSTDVCYQVRHGDSLWRIVREGAPISVVVPAGLTANGRVAFLAHVLYEWNRQVIGSDPNRIFPGQILFVGSRPI